ncbi:hypothetical protein ALC53_05461 [Atta colombica]|uniref:Odorant receptor n=1 Tax=Atta colombica TaxID=520822 RepID=A0A151I447_9HYME|nr:hypothetical protein ALC53_05461 [Atta colombica]
MIQTSTVVTGILIVPRNKTLQDAMVGLVVTIEVFFLLRQMHVHRDLVTQLIQKLNEILCSEDKTMKIIVKSTLKPVEIPLKFYCIVGTGSIFVWCCTSFTVIFKKNYFLYEDYRLPIVLSKQPFSMEMFLLGNCIATIASVYMFVKKVALDVYMINLVLLVTAQYRYIAMKLTTIFRENVPQNQNNESEKKYSIVDSLAILIKMKALCRHHNAVVQITLMLKELFSLNMSLMYLTNVFLFCFLDVMLINAVLSKAPVEGIMIIMYISGGLVQLYILCSCVNQLLNAEFYPYDDLNLDFGKKRLIDYSRQNKFVNSITVNYHVPGRKNPTNCDSQKITPNELINHFSSLMNRVEKIGHLLRLSTNRSNFLLLHKTGSADQPGRVPLIETSDSQREQRLENTAGGVGLSLSTFSSMS